MPSDQISVLVIEGTPWVEVGAVSNPRMHRGMVRFPGMTFTYALRERLEEFTEKLDREDYAPDRG